MTLHDKLTETQSLLHICCTGAGAGLQKFIWDTPGASAYLVGSHFPYAQTQLCAFIGKKPKSSYCSKETAIEMAMTSFIHAVEHKIRTGVSGSPVGLAVTASVASLRIPRGEHRAHIAVITENNVQTRHVTLEKSIGLDARRSHDRIVTQAALQLLECALNDTVQKDESDIAVELLFEAPSFYPNGQRSKQTSRGIYLPASLNPLHDGHRLMAKAAEATLGGPVTFMVNIDPPHKPKQSLQDILEIIAVFRNENKGDSKTSTNSKILEMTRNEALFLEKARARPESHFIIGADTMSRLLEDRWGPQIEPMLSEMRKLGIQFHVMGREIDGSFTTCRDIAVPFPHQLLFRPLDGRLDISSTQLRKFAIS